MHEKGITHLHYHFKEAEDEQAEHALVDEPIEEVVNELHDLNAGELVIGGQSSDGQAFEHVHDELEAVTAPPEVNLVELLEIMLVIEA